MGKHLVSVLLCGWVFWHMFNLNAEWKFWKEPPAAVLTEAACIERASKTAYYERKVRLIVWYADVANKNNWYGCFPDGYDPGDSMNSGGSATTTK